MIHLVQRLYEHDFLEKAYWYKGGVFVKVCSGPTQKGLHAEPCLPDCTGGHIELQGQILYGIWMATTSSLGEL